MRNNKILQSSRYSTVIVTDSAICNTKATRQWTSSVDQILTSFPDCASVRFNAIVIACDFDGFKLLLTSLSQESALLVDGYT